MKEQNQKKSSKKKSILKWAAVATGFITVGYLAGNEEARGKVADKAKSFGGWVKGKMTSSKPAEGQPEKTAPKSNYGFNRGK